MLTYTASKLITLAVKELYINILINKVLHITKRDLKYVDTDTLILQQMSITKFDIKSKLFSLLQQTFQTK